MKKLLLSFLLGGAVAGATAGVNIPASFTSDFTGAYNQGMLVPEGWTTIGMDAKVGDPYTNTYRDYSLTNAYKMMGWSAGQAAFSASTMEDASGNRVESDQWLISPEFEIKENMEMISFLVAANGNVSRNKFAVYLSEDGVTKEAFEKNRLLDATLIGEQNSVNTATRRIVLDGYAGKKVHLAFVNYGNTSGQMGFSNVLVAPYYITINNAAQIGDIVVSDAETIMNVSMSMSTPVSCKGFKAVLETSEGFTSVYESTVSFSKSKITTVNIKMPDYLKVKDVADYTLTITPNFEGAPATVLTGKLTFAPSYYARKAIVEEFTGTWCGWCPRGIAFLEYFRDKYNTDYERFISIGLHYNDPMATDLDYLIGLETKLTSLGGELGFPLATMNRNVFVDPSELPVEEVLNSKSFAKTDIVGTELVGKKVKVRCSSRVTYDTEDADMGLAIALVENKIKGNNTDYDQADYFGQYPLAAITDAYGSDMGPYFELFANRPSQTVPFSEITYNDVNRGIYPDYLGQKIVGSWVADTPRIDEVEFTLPETVKNVENLAVVALLVKQGTNEVFGGDIMYYSDWTDDLSAVEGVKAEALQVSSCAEGLRVLMPSAGNLSVYGVDGRVLFNGYVEAGENVVPMAKGQMVVVNAATANGSRSAKLIL